MADNINLREEIKKLLRLQEVDAEMFDLGVRKEGFPERRKTLDEELERKSLSMKEAEKNMKSVQVQRDAKENDLRSAEEKLRKYDGELAQIKTNKEYKAMLEQIEGAKADVNLLEEKIIMLLDDVDAAKKKFETEKRTFEEEKRRTKAEKEKMASEEKDVDVRLAELQSKKKGIIDEGIDKDLLLRYEKILENRGKYAVAKVNGEFCGACNMGLRPQIINEAKLLRDVVTCESCSRILYDET